MKAFAERLKQAQGDLSQRKFAAKLGIAPGVLSNYMSEKTSPSVDVVAEIAGKLGVSLAWLLGESEATGSRHEVTYADVVTVVEDMLLQFVSSKMFMLTATDKVILLKTSDPVIVEYFNTAAKFRELFVSGAVDKELYVKMIEGSRRRLAGIPIPATYPPDGDDELPF